MAFIVRSPATLVLWASNRTVAGVSLALIWKRIKHTPDRLWRFIVWLLVINVASFALFFGVVRFLPAR